MKPEKIAFLILGALGVLGASGAPPRSAAGDATGVRVACATVVAGGETVLSGSEEEEVPGPRESVVTPVSSLGAFREDPFARRKRNAISYGPHRDGQRPGGPSPSKAEIRDDLHRMELYWDLLRVYGASEFAETMLSIVAEDGLDIRVMLGVWIAPEERRNEETGLTERFPDAADANAREVDAAIRLAAAYPGSVAAVCVGNETQVSWSAHRSPVDILIDHVRQVRAGVHVPVTVADDFQYWSRPESRALASEIDFITMHAHPLWGGQQLEDALEWLRERLAAVRAVHPGRTVVLGETGWATSVHDQGEQAKLIRGRVGEEEQARFYETVRAWAESELLTVFFFEAFDENWKGGEHPAEVEKHWGLFRADRSAKRAMSTEEPEETPAKR